MNNSGVVTYTYDANNKLTQLVGPGGSTTFGYDGNGNMTSTVTPGPITTTYGYDYETCAPSEQPADQRDGPQLHRRVHVTASLLLRLRARPSG